MIANFRLAPLGKRMIPNLESRSENKATQECPVGPQKAEKKHIISWFPHISDE